jgi:two-component system phosphate regulon sensor histidine kinase PhoR
MGENQTIPLAGMMLAATTFLAMVLLGIDLIVALSVTAVWIGSLMLASGRAPDPPQVVKEHPISLTSMERLIEESATPMLVTQKNTIALANRSARRLLGQHMLGQDLRMVFRQPEAISLLDSNRNGQISVRGLVRRRDIWRINRQSFDQDMALIELNNQTAEADISRAHTDFVANASHELRTPLASILGYVETLRESGESIDAPTSQKFLGIIQREGKRLQNLISDLMSLSRVEAEKHDPPSTSVELAGLIKRAAIDAAGEQRRERVDIIIREQPTIFGDVQQLEQVMRNLVDNALKYGALDGKVTVELALTRDGQARITVADTGDGIPPEHIPHLTRRFYRTDPGRSRASGGTGLGLAIVKHIVERHRGRLDIHSELGQGTKVTIRIPIAEKLNAAEATQETDKREHA